MSASADSPSVATGAGATSTAAPATPTAATTPTTRADTPGAELSLTTETWAATVQRIAQHSGKIVVVDVWSTACEPCLKEFPGLVALAEQHAEDVVTISVNCDYIGLKKKPPEFYRERVAQQLRQLRATRVVNILCSEPADDLFVALKVDSIPVVQVYDRQGKLARQFDHRTLGETELSYADHVVPVVNSLRGKPAVSAATPPTAPEQPSAAPSNP